MVIKFYCKCGKKVSVPETERNMEGTCPRCGEIVSLRDADPTTIEREPLEIIDIDGADSDCETNEFGVVQEDEYNVGAEEGTPEIHVGRPAAPSKAEKKQKKPAHDTDIFDKTEIQAELGRPEDPTESGIDGLYALEPVSDPENGEEESEKVVPEGFRHSETEGIEGEESVKARLIYVTSGTHERKTFILDAEVTVIGRSDESDISLNERGVSSKHCRIVDQDGEYIIEDMQSTNGVRVNDKKTDRTVLLKGDKILLGKALFYFMK